MHIIKIKIIFITKLNNIPIFTKGIYWTICYGNRYLYKTFIKAAPSFCRKCKYHCKLFVCKCWYEMHMNIILKAIYFASIICIWIKLIYLELICSTYQGTPASLCWATENPNIQSSQVSLGPCWITRFFVSMLKLWHVCRMRAATRRSLNLFMLIRISITMITTFSDYCLL